MRRRFSPASTRGSREAIRCGTAAVGDISNTLATCAPLAASALDGVVFYEIIGFNPQDPIALVDRARGGDPRARAPRAAAGRAWPPTRRIRWRPPCCGRLPQPSSATACRPAASICAESAEEVEFLRTGGGSMARVAGGSGRLESCVGRAWRQSRSVSGRPGISDLARDGRPRCADDRRRSRCGSPQRRTTLVTCPRSNAYTGAGTPPIEQFYTSGVDVAVGTDSLASTRGLERVFGARDDAHACSAACPRRCCSTAPHVKGRGRSVSTCDYGTIAPGKRARLISVTRAVAAWTMWKNTWCRESIRNRSRGCHNEQMSSFVSFVVGRGTVHTL